MDIVEGNIVEIRVTTRYSKYQFLGMRGKVERISGKSLGIKIPGYKNEASQYGVFWYKPNEVIVVINKEEKVMDQLKGYQKVAVITLGGKIYYYALYADGTEYNVGDSVILSGACNEVVQIDKIMTLEEYQNLPYNPCRSITAEVICKLDTSAYEKRVENRKRAKDLMQQMDRKIKEMDEVNKYEMYAKSNPELAAMLEELKKLV